MRRSNGWTDRLRVNAPATDDAGSAAIEFIFVGVLMLVPLVYLIVTLGLVQGQTLGAEAAARHIARAVATAPDPEAASRRARQVLQAVIADYDLDPATVDLSMSCLPRGVRCPSAGATVRVTVRAQVALPLVPHILGLNDWASVRLESHAAQHVSQFPGSP
ncbi:TadE family protein [Microbacterium mangrovi]|uniref:TadE family protein n=1 Tax=Microbacterium mangrovi TaxID=1348253 RepID=A0A0B2A1Q4_9MICO|nr:TadE family protein [Microbacterium mangrovi]KHK97399.1 TadE family protein [Microbacterium mangrovi]